MALKIEPPGKNARTISIFIPSNNPEGLRIADAFNWTGVCVAFKRSNFQEASRRSEFRKTGVYILIGNGVEGALPRIYVGEGDPVGDRLASHHAAKDFWDWAIFTVSKADALNKAHIQYIEAKLYEAAVKAKRCVLENDNRPGYPTLSEGVLADIELFIDEMTSIFPLLGLSCFSTSSISDSSASVDLFIKLKGIEASGHEAADGFVVKKGSQVVREEVASIQSEASAMRRHLIKEQIVVDAGRIFEFTRDYQFTSASAAAKVVLGASANGRTVWKTKTGKTLKELQTEAAEITRIR